MQRKICTIGFAGKTAEQFFSLLTAAGVKQVVDIRENRVGQLAGYAKFPDLAFFLDRIAGISYRHEPLLAPSPGIRDAYRESHDWARYEESFLTLMRERGVPAKYEAAAFEETFALLCSEPGPEKCHRRLVAELLADHWRGQGHAAVVEHLFLPEPVKKKSKKKRAANDRVDPQ
jgi:uncharacterized protein (DUF488 family)